VIRHATVGIALVVALGDCRMCKKDPPQILFPGAEGGVEAPTVGAFDAGAEPLGREAPREGAGDVRGEVLEFRDAPGAAAQRDEIDPSRCVVADQPSLWS
jgi:hypothetical protein